MDTLIIEDEIIEGDDLEFLIDLCDEVVFKKLEGKAAIGMIKKTIYRTLLARLWHTISDYDLVYSEQSELDRVIDGGDILPIGNDVGLTKNGSSTWKNFLMGYQQKEQKCLLIPSDRQHYVYQRSVEFIRQMM